MDDKQKAEQDAFMDRIRAEQDRVNAIARRGAESYWRFTEGAPSAYDPKELLWDDTARGYVFLSHTLAMLKQHFKRDILTVDQFSRLLTPTGLIHYMHKGRRTKVLVDDVYALIPILEKCRAGTTDETQLFAALDGYEKEIEQEKARVRQEKAARGEVPFQ